MSTTRRICVLAGLMVGLAVASYCIVRPRPTVPEDPDHAGRPARIDPDYSGCTIPPNIAPLNFVVQEPGTDYRVRVYSRRGEGFLLAGSTPGIVIPAKKWKALLELNRGGDLHFDVYARGEKGRWLRFDTLTNRIAREEVDSYLVYRRLKPVHNVFKNMGTYQRNLSTYEESPVLLSGRDSGRCVNCHTFVNNRPDTMSLHLRSKKDGLAMILVREGKAVKIDTRTSFNSSPAAYTSWHPNGRLAAFSAIQVGQFHHAVGNSRDVFVNASDLCVYDADSNSVSSVPQIAHPDRLEIFCTWSPDGKHLWFCSAERLWETGAMANKGLPFEYRKARYDLMRIGYDEATGAWGELQPVLLSKDTGLSINEPRISPDGRFLLFCMADYGCFPVFRQSSDLYMMDLKTGRHWPLEINSGHSDSWHCWSSNGRWIVFASKRRDGLFGRAYLSYVDPAGKAHKPILLPQEDPAFYASFLDNFNAPELITGPIRIEQEDLVRAIEGPQESRATFVGVSPASGVVSGEKNSHEPEAGDPPMTVDVGKARRNYELGEASQKQGRIAEAVQYYRRSVRFVHDYSRESIPASNNLAWIYATCPSEHLRDSRKAVLLAERAHKTATMMLQSSDESDQRHAQAFLPVLTDTLAAAYAESARFPMAVEAAVQAETLALNRGRLELAVRIRDRLKLYLINKPYRAASPSGALLDASTRSLGLQAGRLPNPAP